MTHQKYVTIIKNIIPSLTHINYTVYGHAIFKSNPYYSQPIKYQPICQLSGQQNIRHLFLNSLTDYKYVATVPR